MKLLPVVALCGVALASPSLAQTKPVVAPGPKVVVSDPEKLEKAAEAIVQMKGALRAALGRVEEARNEKDVVKLNCVNEKLTQIKGLLKVAEQSDIQLHEAVVNKDPVADSEFAKINIAKTKVDGLRRDAEQCIGQLAYIVDEKTTVEVQQPPGLADPDRPSRTRDDDGWRRGGRPPVVRPQPASSFLP